MVPIRPSLCVLQVVAIIPYLSYRASHESLKSWRGLRGQYMAHALIYSTAFFAAWPLRAHSLVFACVTWRWFGMDAVGAVVAGTLSSVRGTGPSGLFFLVGSGAVRVSAVPCSALLSAQAGPNSRSARPCLSHERARFHGRIRSPTWHACFCTSLATWRDVVARQLACRSAYAKLTFHCV